jgi:hypothetical protein
MYNNLWRIGASGVAVLRFDDLNKAKHVATGIDEVSQAARNWFISFKTTTSAPHRLRVTH